MELKRILFFVLSIAISAKLALSPKVAFAATTDKSSSESEEAEPYSPDEFPEWSKKIRRAGDNGVIFQILFIFEIKHVV